MHSMQRPLLPTLHSIQSSGYLHSMQHFLLPTINSILCATSVTSHLTLYSKCNKQSSYLHCPQHLESFQSHGMLKGLEETRNRVTDHDLSLTTKTMTRYSAWMHFETSLSLTACRTHFRSCVHQVGQHL